MQSYEQAARTVRDHARAEYYHKESQLTLEDVAKHLPSDLNPEFISMHCELAGYPLKETKMDPQPPYENRPCQLVSSGSDWVLWKVGGEVGQKKVVFVVCSPEGKFLCQSGTKKKMMAWIAANK